MSDRRASTMADREVMAMLLTSNVQLVAEVLREDVQGEGQAMRAIAATRSLDLIVDDTLQALVLRARDAGHTWAAIGEVLHVTRQAAFQRFGGGASIAWTSAPGSSAPIRGAAKVARSVLKAFLDGHPEEVRARFDDRMLESFSIELLADVRERVRAGGGEVRTIGDPIVSMRDGLTVVDIPVTLERARGTGQVILDAEGRVAGFFVRPTGPDL